VFRTPIYAASGRVDQGKAGLRKDVFTRIETDFGRVYEAETWKKWAEITEEHHPDSIILIVHTKQHPELLVDQLEIGNEDFLVQNYLGEKYIDSSKHPFTVVIGCEVIGTDNQGFDISSEFLAKGSSVVLSNFTKIRGRQAGEIVMKLSEFLKLNKGKEILFGEVVLKLKQYLLAEGIMAGLAVVCYGDADWKIKC
jgi:hypothetical protein